MKPPLDGRSDDRATRTECEPRHTPGPWRLEEPDTDDRGHFHEARIWHDGDGTAAHPEQHIAVIRCGLAASEANARLIAAAPELLKALKELMTYPRNLEKRAAAELRANAAIAKAEGRS